jgi:hypothetical protein
MPDPSQFNTDRTCPGRWTVAFSNQKRYDLGAWDE